MLARAQCEAQREGVGVQGIAQRVVIGSGAGQHITLDVAAGGQGRKQAFVDAADRGFQVVLEHAVELKLLARRDPQAAVADGLRKLVARQVLLGRKPPAHDPHPHHELVGFFLAFLLERTAQVAIVLLVRAVKLQDRTRRLR